ncbi:MAG: SGNH/GDSL hydrolase family protein [Planctomycetota bacterium]
MLGLVAVCVRRGAALRLAVLLPPLVVSTETAFAQPAWNELVVFGDSLSDVGNVRQRSADLSFGLFVTPDDRYDRGRFSNGPVWIERVADALGLDASTRSYRAPGTNYAYGGAVAGTGSSSLTVVRNVGWQVDEYLLREARTPTADTLVVLWAGANDFLNGSTNTTGPTDDILGYLERLYDAGARDFLVPNLPPLGQTPGFVGVPNAQTQRNANSAAHNTYLNRQLEAFANTRDARIFTVDVQGLFFDLLEDPFAFGINDAIIQAINLPAGSDVSDYLFWDDVHPTATGHQLVADAALAQLLALTGDYDGDGRVAQGDLNLVLSNWGRDVAANGAPAGWVGAAPLGTVDQTELNGVLGAWGSSAIPDLRGVVVPEPAVVALLVGAAWSGLRRG